MTRVYIEPGRSNQAAEDEGHWKIMIEENNAVRHLNDAKSKGQALEKGEATAHRRDCAFDGVSKTAGASAGYKPKGMPPIGATVRRTMPQGGTRDEVVTGYLDGQFVTKLKDGRERILGITEEWEIV
jgi:hypothetical protein